MSEVERLHYVNGRRLDAADLRLEQHYHIAIRRLLNRGLFTPGVVTGLTVTEASATEVYVEPGLALDPLGQEIVLPELRTVSVPAQPATSNADGYFLVIRYAEERLAGANPDCGPPITEAARIREEPILEWTERPPSHVSCRKGTGDPLDCGIVLALVHLTAACEISLVEISVREVAFPANASRVTGVALEGEKDIDKDNPKVLHFQIRGGPPSSVLLYLWGGKFSSLYYTQLGEHEHTLKKSSLVLSEDTSAFPDHRHGLADHTHRPQGTNAAGNLETVPVNLAHSHNLLTERRGNDATQTRVPYAGVQTQRKDWWELVYLDMSDHVGGGPPETRIPRPWVGEGLMGQRRLELSLALGGRVNLDGSPALAETLGLAGAVGGHSHSHSLVADVDVSSTGSPEYRAGSSAAYGYLTDMRVSLDGTDVTSVMLDVLPTSWGQLGDGLATHELVTDGTGAIDLLDIARAAGRTIAVGSHELEFRVASGGGKVLYNLIVE